MASTRRVPFLFDPAAVRTTLASFVARPRTESRSGGRRSRADRFSADPQERAAGLPGTRTTRITSTSWISLAHTTPDSLQHEEQQAPASENAPPQLSSFAPDLGELRVAEHFAIAGCEIAGFDESKGESAVARISLRRATASASPSRSIARKPSSTSRASTMTWCPGIKNIDLPWDFAFRLFAFEKLAVELDDAHRLTYLLDGVLDDTLGAAGRGRAIWLNEFIVELAART